MATVGGPERDRTAVHAVIERCFRQDAEWHTMRELPGGGVVHGRTAVEKELLDQWSAFAEIEMEMEDLRAVGDQVVTRLVLRTRPHGGGGALETRVGNLWTFEQGEVLRVRAFRDHAEALAVAEAEAA